MRSGHLFDAARQGVPDRAPGAGCTTISAWRGPTAQRGQPHNQATQWGGGGGGAVRDHSQTATAVRATQRKEPRSRRQVTVRPLSAAAVWAAQRKACRAAVDRSCSRPAPSATGQPRRAGQCSGHALSLIIRTRSLSLEHAGRRTGLSTTISSPSSYTTDSGRSSGSSEKDPRSAMTLQ